MDNTTPAAATKGMTPDPFGGCFRRLPIKGVTVNGKAWTDYDKDKEAITLKGLTGTVAVTARARKSHGQQVGPSWHARRGVSTRSNPMSVFRSQTAETRASAIRRRILDEKASRGPATTDAQALITRYRSLKASEGLPRRIRRGRSDNKAIARFVVVDVQDPANPKMVSDKNWLGFAEPPSDIFIEQYYKDIDPFQFVGSYAGAVSQFMRMGGPVAVGKRLLLQTTAFLYCIGEK